MSPRSEEFIEQARDRVEYARRHGGVWHLFHRRYVDGAADFLAAVEKMLDARE